MTFHAYVQPVNPTGEDVGGCASLAGVNSMVNKGTYTCLEYRTEMRLLGLRRRLEQQDLAKEEREALIQEIRQLEAEMEMD